MSSVTLKNITKVFPDGTKAIDNLNLSVEDKEFLVLVGASGCGKSTVLRMIAGLEKVTSGDIYVGNQLCTNLMPRERDIAMVFQNYALYPNMSVRENLAFGLKLSRKFSLKEINIRIDEAAEILEITDLMDKKPLNLSGGQRQRVALGRCIVRKPRVFLFDEPLSNLDAKMRNLMRVEIGKLHARMQTTMIYVTHDQTEAMTMGDRIVCMKNGEVQQIAKPMDLYNNPTNSYVAGFIGMPSMNFFDCKLDTVSSTFTIIDSDESFVLNKSNLNPDFGSAKMSLGVRPEQLEMVAEDKNAIKAVVEVVEPLGAETHVYARYSKGNVVFRLSDKKAPEIGEVVYLRPDKNCKNFFDLESGVRLW